MRIGLTGGIASGKSTVAERFVELGIPVIDADDSSRWVVAAGQPGLAAVTARFGTGILTQAGEIDRRALRNVVFADPEARKDLETILHPLIRADMDRRAAIAAGPYLVMAIPLLVGKWCARSRRPHLGRRRCRCRAGQTALGEGRRQSGTGARNFVRSGKPG